MIREERRVEMHAVKEAIRVILSDHESLGGSLNWAVNYCNAALNLIYPEDLKWQCRRILGNITGWRHPRAKEVRDILKKFGELK